MPFFKQQEKIKKMTGYTERESFNFCNSDIMYLCDIISVLDT